MSRSLRSIKDPLERQKTIERRIREHKGVPGVGGLGYLAAYNAKKKESKDGRTARVQGGG